MSTPEPVRGAATTTFEITRFTKADGGLMTKVLTLDGDGTVTSDGSSCRLREGTAERVNIANVAELAALIKGLRSDQAIALGRLRGDLPAVIPMMTKANLVPGGISRTSDFIEFAKGQPAFCPIDVDTKGMPDEMREQIAAIGGFGQAVRGVMPELAECAQVARSSTSSWIWRNNVNPGQWLKQDSGWHFYVPVTDGSDIPRFLRVFADRCWLAGFGWMTIGAGGQLLTKSLVDSSVGRAEGLLFEGPPHLLPPLVQDATRREPIAVDGGLLDTVQVCPPLSLVEQAKLSELRAKERQRLQPEATKARATFEESRAAEIALGHGRGKASPADRSAAIRACEGKLLSTFVLPFDDPALAGTTVADVLADPIRFVDETLADPLEGPGYGTCKAKIMLRADGSPWIHSFAHGRSVYHLLHDVAAVRAALQVARREQVVAAFAAFSIASDLAPGEHAEIRQQAAVLSGVGARDLDKAEKQMREAHGAARDKEERNRRAAERQDPRPQIKAPALNAPWLPQMQVLNEVLGASTALEPPMRDIDGVVTQVRVRRVPNMHALTQLGTNEGEALESRLPPPEQLLLTRLADTQLAELIEQHIDYVDKNGRSVHLGVPFVKHFHTRTDDALPTVAAIATLPIMLADTTLLAKRGLDRDRGIVFRVPDELLQIMPKAEDCTLSTVAEAMNFLTDEWLCDVSTDYAGKCILIASVLTVIERALLPERPVFFVTAGRRGGGKTTTLIMLLMAATGVRPSAAAWSTDAEERRKALLAYLMEALAAIVWDNIPRGMQISCPHIEKSCTSAFYSDRKLGVTELVAVAALAIHFFTGNNIGPRGDLASRSLQVRLEVDRADPENRPFMHPDPIGWTEANRGRILVALYTIMLGNPAMRPGSNVAAQTRFKTWWRLVGSAVEHAAGLHLKDTAERIESLPADCPICPPMAMSFRDLFLAQETDDELSGSLADALTALRKYWPPDAAEREDRAFTAAALAAKLNNTAFMAAVDKERVETLREFLFSDLAPNKPITVKATSRRLKRHLDEPIKVGDKILCLKASKDAGSEVLSFFVRDN